MRELYPILYILASALFLLSCVFSLPDDWEGNINDGTIKERSDLFEKDDSDPLSPFVFYSDDSDDSGPLGTTFWIPLANSNQDVFSEWAVVVNKTNGKSTAGYGIVICQGDHGAEDESMLTVMIRVDGHYQIAKVIGTDYEPFDNWKTSSRLNIGYGNNNTIGVSRFGSEFVLSFNGIEEYRFQDTEAPVHNGGIQGFVAVVAPNETYSGTVRITFDEVE